MLLDRKIATLYVYKSSHGLPSIDPKCLQILFYLRLNPNHNVRIKTSGFGTSPVLPMLEYDGKTYTAQEAIFRKLDELIELPCDELVSTQQHKQIKSRILSYKILTLAKLENIFILNLWGIEANSSYLARIYGSEKYFPFGIVFSRRLNAHTQNLVHAVCDARTFEESIVHSNEKFEKYLTDLSCLLNGTSYLMGDKPCSLDALLCGYLAPLLVLTLPNPRLYNILKKHDKLVRYVQKYINVYGDKSVEESLEDTVVRDIDNDRASIGLVICAGVFAVMTMVGYGIMKDIIKTK